MHDHLIPFTFEDLPFRGKMVTLDKTWREIISDRTYDITVQTLLGELLTASTLLGSSLKFNGSFLIQIIGEGPVSMLVVETRTSKIDNNETNPSFSLRGVAKVKDEELNNLTDTSLDKLIGKGTLSITLEPEEGDRAYQSIIPVNGSQVSEIFEDYMKQSEQIETRLFLFSDNSQCTGLLLQKMPNLTDEEDNSEKTDKEWKRVNQLTESISPQELIETSSHLLLKSTFPEDTIRVYDPQKVEFACSCSREKIGSLIITLGEEDASQLIQEEGSIRVTCEFCGTLYEFDRIDTSDLFINSSIRPSPEWEN